MAKNDRYNYHPDDTATFLFDPSQTTDGISMFKSWLIQQTAEWKSQINAL